MGRELWVSVGLCGDLCARSLKSLDKSLDLDLILDKYTYVPWGMIIASYILTEAASHTGR